MIINRIRFIFFCFIILFLILVVRLVNISLLSDDARKSQYSPKQNSNLLRGNIYSVNKDTLGVTIPFYSLYINPEEIDKKKVDDYLYLFSQLGISATQSQEILTSKKKFRWLVRMISKESFLSLQKYMALSIPGVGTVQEYKRVYPHHQMAAPILGFTNIDGKGLSGIEYTMNNYLEPSIFSQAQDHILGYDIVLTLDSRLQLSIENILNDTAIELNPQSISAIIMEADTGKILTMASFPSFDPNVYNTYKDPKVFKNTSISNIDEPGSTFKPLIMAHLFDRKLITEKSRVTSAGREKINGYTLKESTGKNLGTISPKEVLMYSSNIGMVKLSQGLSREDIYNLLKSLKLGEKTNIMLPGEEKGIIRNPSEMTSRSKLSIPIGQEIGIPPLQLVSAFTALANGGVQSIPRIIERMEYEGKEVSLNLQEQVTKKIPIYSTASANLILKYMRDIVLHGSARKTNIPGEWIAAKTGTAQIFDNEKKIYNNLNTSVIAIYEHKSTKKRYVVYGVIRVADVDENITWGGTLAAPMVKKMILSLRDILNKP